MRVAARFFLIDFIFCSTDPPSFKATEVASISITAKCIILDVIGVKRSVSSAVVAFRTMSHNVANGDDCEVIPIT